MGAGKTSTKSKFYYVYLNFFSGRRVDEFWSENCEPKTAALIKATTTAGPATTTCNIESDGTITCGPYTTTTTTTTTTTRTTTILSEDAKIAIASISVFSVGIISAFLVIWWFRKRKSAVVKSWDGIPLDDVTEAEFDFFLCYCECDFEFAIILLEFLEGENFACKIQIRDFDAGRLIAEQVDEAVTTSRRTLLILNRNTVEDGLSSRFRMEFGVAHSRRKALFVAYNENDVDALSDSRGELGDPIWGYVTTKTILTFNDSQFVQKLKTL